MAIFRVVEYMNPANVLTKTDDWVEAHRAAIEYRAKSWELDHYPVVLGTHPSHVWPEPRGPEGMCQRCGLKDNGAWRTQIPCGFPVRGRDLVSVITGELKARRREAANMSEPGTSEEMQTAVRGGADTAWQIWAGELAVSGATEDMMKAAFVAGYGAGYSARDRGN